MAQTPTPSPSSTAASIISITSVSGASSWSNTNTALGVVIYGGVAGLDTSCPTDGSTMCNNCVFSTTTPLACNQQRIYDNLYLTVTFTVTANVSGYVGFGYSNASGVKTRFSTGTSGQYVTKGNTTTVTAKWFELCQAIQGTTGTPYCSSTAISTTQSTPLYISIEATVPAQFATNVTQFTGYVLAPPTSTSPAPDLLTTVSPNSGTDSGIFKFYARAGDHEVAIESLGIQGPSCPATYTAARFFYVPDDGTGSAALFSSATYGAALSTDLPLGNDCTPSGDWTISGLNNDVGYFFNVSILDAAKNNFFLIDPSLIAAAGCGGTLAGSIVGAAADAACDFYATPSAVEALLPNNFNCFIATAAYGSAWAPAVVTLRKFRDQFLITNSLGRIFTKEYYKIGPHYAKIIRSHDWLRAAARFALTPVWGFAWLSLYYTPIGALLMLITILAFSIVSLRRYQRGQW